MFNYFKAYTHQKAFCVAMAVLTAVVVNELYSFSKEGWIVFAAFIVCQTTRGTPLKQGLNYFFMVALIAIVFPTYAMHMIKLRLLDVLIGGVIGLVFSQLLFSKRYYAEFSRGIAPIFSALTDDLQQIAHHISEQKHDVVAEKKLFAVESVLGTRESMYPEWVYEVGFNPGLRAGFRFFLLNTEYLGEVVFSINYLVARALSSEHMQVLRPAILLVMQHNATLLKMLHVFFSQDEVPATFAQDDYTSDMQALEDILNNHVPVNIELLDIEPDYVVLTAIVRGLKDMRDILLQLMLALPI